MENLPAPPAVAERKFEIEDDYYAVSGAEVPFASLEEAKKEYDLTNKRMTLVSNKLGEKMIAGFSMLSTVCPSEACRGTPLVRLGSAPMVCVSCDREYLISSLGDLVTTKTSGTPAAAAASNAAPATTTAIPASASAVVPMVPAAPACTPAAPSADPSFFLDMHNAPVLDLHRFAYDSNDASTQISKRLMQGWALLDHCCQSAKCKGEVPLMRDLSGKVRSALTCHFYISSSSLCSSAMSQAAHGSWSAERLILNYSFLDFYVTGSMCSVQCTLRRRADLSPA
jgi:uncharacterized Zn finger protein (UPF0148 family)